MSTPPPARELTLRNDRRSRRVLCMGHLTVGGSIYFSAGRSEVGKRDCRGIMRRIVSHLTVLARECKGPLLPAALPSSTGLQAPKLHKARVRDALFRRENLSN